MEQTSQHGRTFVEPNTTTQASTTEISFIMCRNCADRSSTASVFDPFGVLLTTINLNTPSGVQNRTFSYANASIGSLLIDLGANFDGVESITFATPTSVAAPEPASMLLLGTGLVAAGVRRWRQKRDVG